MDATTQITPQRFLDVLPARAGGKRQALEWFPVVDDYGHGEGFVKLTSAHDTTTYAVSQHPGDGPLLAFVFTKIEGKGTDAGRTNYLLTCTRNGNEVRCDCKGHMRHGTCRHADALETLFLNRWLSS
jgi:hypothetical protein